MYCTGNVDDQMARLMIRTIQSRDSRPLYAEAAALATAEVCRVAWFSPAWFHYKARARYYRKVSR